MSTTTQRPTPETDDIFDAYARCACGTACVRAKMQQIERERDEAREQLEAMREAIREAHEAFKNVMELQPDVPPWANTEAMLALAKLQPFLKS